MLDGKRLCMLLQPLQLPFKDIELVECIVSAECFVTRLSVAHSHIQEDQCVHCTSTEMTELPLHRAGAFMEGNKSFKTHKGRGH